MSRKKPKSLQKPVSREIVPEKKGKGFARSFAQMMFIVGGALSAIFAIFTALTPKQDDTINDYINNNIPSLPTWEWVFFSVIAIGFLYFSFKWIFRVEKRIYDYIALGLVFLAINGVFVLAFDTDLGSFDDNAQYIVHSRSLIEMGGPYDLYYVNQAYTARAPIGFPLMLAPITAIWGFDVLKMKILVFFLGGLSMIFFFLSFRKLCSQHLAALLVMAIGSYPLFVYNTCYVMTEVPFVFTLSITVFSALKLKESEARRKVALWLALTILSAFLCYMTRAVGVAMIGALVAWLFFHIPWTEIYKKREKLFSMPTYKFLVVSGALVSMFLGWQLYSSIAVKRDMAKRGVDKEEVVQVADDAQEAPDTEKTEIHEFKKSSQLAQFLGTDFIGRFSENYKRVSRLWGQQFFSKKLSRWYLSLGKAAVITKMNGALLFFNIILLLSLVAGLARRDIMAFGFLFLTLVTLAGASSVVEMVYTRYFIPLVPFMAYLLVRLLPDIADFITRKRAMPVLSGFASLSTVIFLFFMLFNNFSGNAFNIQRQHSGDAYTIAFDNFLKAGTWVKDNLPEDAIIASRKPRLFYIYSERRGVYTVTHASQVYSPEIEAERLEFFSEKGVDYIIMDAFSTASRQVVLPIIQNNPDNFQIVQTVGEKYSSYVVRFIE